MGRRKAAGRPVWVWCAVHLRGGAAHRFLCLDLAIPNDLGGGFGILCVRFNQLCDVLEILIELGGGHFGQVLTSFRKRFPVSGAVHLCLTRL